MHCAQAEACLPLPLLPAGTLPSSWGNPLAFRQLFGLWIAENDFKGAIPASWAGAARHWHVARGLGWRVGRAAAFPGERAP